MTDGNYWFARRFPVGHPRRAMAPVTREGHLAFISFGAAMAIAALAFLGLAVSGMATAGAAAFVLIAALAGGTLLWLLGKRGDRTRTTEDYRRLRAGRG